MPRARHNSQRGFAIVWLAALLAAWSPAPAAASNVPDGRFLEALRARRLYSLAESYCQRQLARTDLTDEQQARLAVELSRTLVDHAAQSQAPAQDELWRKAAETTDRFIALHKDSPWLVLVETQGALVPLARGELARARLGIAANDDAALEGARSNLRTAVRQLDELAKKLEQRLRDRPPATSTPGGPPNERQLKALSDNVRLSLARALRSQGQSYPEGSPDRTAALARAVKLLEPLSEVAASGTTTWASRLELVTCLRLLNDREAAERAIERMEGESPPAEVRQLLLAERMRLALAADDVDAALSLAAATGQSGPLSAEFAAALLDVYMAAWQRSAEARQTAEVARWRSAAEQVAQHLRTRHGALWARRADLAMADTVRHLSGTTEVDLLVEAAESYFRAERIDEAIAAYDLATKQAQAAGNDKRAFDIAFAAATVEHQRDRHLDSAERFHNAARIAPQHARAAEADLLAIYHAGRLAASDEANAAALDRYRDWMNQHLETWPDAESADEVRWRLARLLEHDGDSTEAITAYRAIRPASPRYAEALDRLAALQFAMLERSRSAGEPVRDEATAAVRFFEELTRDVASRKAASWSAPERAAALAAARLRLEFIRGGYDQIELRLGPALADPEAPSQWRAQALPVFLMALAAQGKAAEALPWIEKLDSASPEALVDMLERLVNAPALATDAGERFANDLALRLAELVAQRREDLEPALQRRSELAAALALARAGQHEAATARLAELARQQPRNAEIQERYAEQLLAHGNTAQLEEALNKWRELERGSPAGDMRWYRAKLALAETHSRLGDAKRAVEIITLTRTLHPDLGGPAMKAKFLDLLARCERSP